jgi:hypothetical protein
MNTLPSKLLLHNPPSPTLKWIVLLNLQNLHPFCQIINAWPAGCFDLELCEEPLDASKAIESWLVQEWRHTFIGHIPDIDPMLSLKCQWNILLKNTFVGVPLKEKWQLR